MKAIELTQFGLDHLAVVDRPDPSPGPGEIRLAMKAVSLNYRDLLMVRGKYDPRLKLPIVPCSDGVGVVDAIGDGVRRFSGGERVCPIFCQRWLAGEPTRDALRSTLGGPLGGTLAQQMIVPAESVVTVPEHLTDPEAATLPCAAVTAWSALVTEGGVTAGDTVLVQGTGGVSLFALQFARIIGARVIATTGSPSKADRLRDLGAEHVVDYRQDAKWGKTVRSLTDGRGVDHVVEVAGGASLAQSLAAVRPGGTVSVIGILGGATSELSLLPLLMSQVRMQGVLVGHRESFEAMNRAIEAAKLRPIVDRTLEFADAKNAFEHLGSGEHFGKVVIAVDQRA